MIDAKQPKRIFIGGTGRSGTTILGKVLSSHPKIYTFMRELRFHVDPYGLRSLHHALTEGYSPPVARQAYMDFSSLMLEKLCMPSSPPYIGFNLPVVFGQDFYFDHLRYLKDRLTYSDWTGNDYHISGSILDRSMGWLYRPIERVGNAALKRSFKSQFAQGKRVRFSPKQRLSEPRYFSDAGELAQIMGAFVDDLLMARTIREDRVVWCEQTPGNAINATFLASMLPNSCLVYIYRNPWSLALSYRRQKWATDSLEDVCLGLQVQLQKWARERKKLNEIGYSFLEISLEELTDNPSHEMKKISDLAGIEPSFTNLNLLDQGKHSISIAKLDKGDQNILEKYFPGQAIPQEFL